MLFALSCIAFSFLKHLNFYILLSGQFYHYLGKSILSSKNPPKTKQQQKKQPLIAAPAAGQQMVYILHPLHNLMKQSGWVHFYSTSIA